MGGTAGQQERPRSGAADGAKPVIAVFNSSSDTVDLLRTTLEQEGFHTVAGRIPEIKQGAVDFISFIEHHDPAVIIYDVSMPYEANWNFLRLVRSSGAVVGTEFVLTTTNKPALDALVGDSEAIEIIGKPYDLQQVVAAVRSALARSA
jgi:DNA-binding response OmpR family regulator